MRISDWSSDVCSSDLICVHRASSHALQIFEGQRVLIATGQDLGRTLPGELSGVQHTKEAAVLGFTVDRTRTAGLQESDRPLDRGVVQADAETGREAAEVTRGWRIQRNVDRGKS